MKRFVGLVSALLALGVGAAASADEPLGLYVGAGVGESTIRSDDPGYGLPGYYNDHETAWKGVVGIHPWLLPIGAEAEYIDFGQPGHHYAYDDPAHYGEDSHPRAPALFAVGYLPIPIPFVELFAKAGVAHLKLTENYVTTRQCTGTVCTSINNFDRHDVSNTKLAYGAGVQSRLPLGFEVRAEYERISSSYGDPDAFTVSALWRW